MSSKHQNNPSTTLTGTRRCVFFWFPGLLNCYAAGSTVRSLDQIARSARVQWIVGVGDTRTRILPCIWDHLAVNEGWNAPTLARITHLSLSQTIPAFAIFSDFYEWETRLQMAKHLHCLHNLTASLYWCAAMSFQSEPIFFPRLRHLQCLITGVSSWSPWQHASPAVEQWSYVYDHIRVERVWGTRCTLPRDTPSRTGRSERERLCAHHTAWDRERQHLLCKQHWRSDREGEPRSAGASDLLLYVASLPMLTHTIYSYLQDFANPLVRPFIHVYPEISPSSLSEPWHFKKWAQELGPEFLTPMAIGHKKQHFYVRELAMTFDHEFIIPLRWVIDHGDLCAFSWPVNTLEVRYYDFYC